MSSSQRAGEVPCPDPSAHEHGHKLSEQASTAALYATNPARGADSRKDVLGSDGKLSASSAAASLKYARAQDLPSFPSHGLDDADSAGKAAMLAKDYKMKDLWQPEASSAGSKAALLAARDGGKLDLWQPSATKEGNSAATLAMRNKGLSPQIDYGYTQDGRQKALMAATLSVKRGRSGSQPTPAAAAYPDSKNSVHNALNAATVSHRASVKMAPDGWDSEANQAARIKNYSGKVDRAMFGEHPPVQIEKDEQQHEAALRASAISMAKQMYDYQNRTIMKPDLTGGKAGADAANSRKQPTEQMDVKQEALRYIHLQDAAHKLAQERLAKIDKNSEAARYREYYGYPDSQGSRKSVNRLSMRSRPRAGSEGAADPDDSDDEEQARRIRSQMSQLNTGLNTVDEKKRSDDRARLLAAAEKKVHAQMHDMDEKVFANTGKVPPAMMEEWEEKAKIRAQEQRELNSRPENKGKLHIGGGKFMDRSEIEAIAAARLKPTLDEISDTAAKRRARDEEIRAEKDKQETARMNEKMKDRQQKEEWKRVRDEDKATARREKGAAKVRKEEEKMQLRKSREAKRPAATEIAGVSTTKAPVDNEKQRGSTAGKFASRLRGNKPSGEDERASESVAGSATGVVGGAEASKDATLSDADDDEGVSKARDDDEEGEVEPQTHVTILAPTVTEPSGTAIPAELERHISRIETSDEDDDELGDDEDASSESDNTRLTGNESAEKDQTRTGSLGDNEAHIVANRVGTAPVDESAGKIHQTNERTDVTLPESGTAALASNVGTAATGVSPAARNDKSAGLDHDDTVAVVDASAKTLGKETRSISGGGTTTKQAPATKTGSDRPTQTQESATKDQRGIRGFFSKLTSRQSKPHDETPERITASDSKPIGRGVIKNKDSTGTRIVGDSQPASPSSFNRHEGGSKAVDDVSSSSADGEDVARGRSSISERLKDYTKAEFGLGDLDKGPHPNAASNAPAHGTDDESDQFEEARDHFDEGLAPPPAFAGQKSESPHRETRFREEV